MPPPSVPELPDTFVEPSSSEAPAPAPAPATCIQSQEERAVPVPQLDGRTVGGERYLGGQSETAQMLSGKQVATSNKPVWPRRLAETRGDSSGARKKGRMCCRRDLE